MATTPHCPGPSTSRNAPLYKYNTHRILTPGVMSYFPAECGLKIDTLLTLAITYFITIRLALKVRVVLRLEPP